VSTCRGALAPHLDCPHGDRCDWVAPEVRTLPVAADQRSRLDFLREALGEGARRPDPARVLPNRAERRRAGRR